MGLDRRLLPVLSAALLATVTALAQERTAMRVSIGGSDIPDAAQPRVVVESQRGRVAVARIEVSGVPGAVFAAGVAPGDLVEIAAYSQHQPPVPVFSGTVVSLDPQPDLNRTSVVIHASGGPVEEDREPTPLLAIDARPGGDARLLAFAPRLSSTSSLQEVLITGIDASTGSLITGLAVAPTLHLGSAGSGASFGTRLTVDTGLTFSSGDEAQAFAARLMDELLAPRISAEVVATGLPELRVGASIEIHGTDTRFNGKYFVTGVSHRFGGDSFGGYSSSLRLHRADHGMFHLPEVDDEVLVAFEHGDIARPFVVDSWWNCDRSRPSGRSDDEDQCRLLRWPW